MPRRSQRLRTQPQGRENDQQRTKRNNRENEVEVVSQNAVEPKQKRQKRYELTTSNLQRHQQESDLLDQMGRTRKIPIGSPLTKPSTVTTTDKTFGEVLRKNHVVYEPGSTIPPDDCERLKTALLIEREIPVSAHDKWERMRLNKQYETQCELSLESSVIESMLTPHEKDAPYEYSRYRNDAWTEVDSEITNGLSDAKPDVTETYLWAAYPEGAREVFDDLVVSQYGYAMPTFVMESKGPAGIPRQAVKQAAYDGALMTHAALAVDSILGRGPSSRYRRTKAITVTLDDSITVYANHAILVKKSGKEEIHYHQYKVARVDYMDSETEWNRAHSLLYNAQKLGLRLATIRIKSIKAYFDDKKPKQDAELIDKQTELQEQARAKVQTATAALSHHRDRKPDDNGSSVYQSEKSSSESPPEKKSIGSSSNSRTESSSTSRDKPSPQPPKSPNPGALPL